MLIERIAAFSDGDTGGNPAGVALLTAMPPGEVMQGIAAEVGYSETVFAVPLATAGNSWRVRYFSPETEVPFCGHATIALGAVLGKQHGPGSYTLHLNDAVITVEAGQRGSGFGATLSSPPTASRALSQQELNDALALLSLDASSLDPRLPPAHIHAGADHAVLTTRY